MVKRGDWIPVPVVMWIGSCRELGDPLTVRAEYRQADRHSPQMAVSIRPRSGFGVIEDTELVVRPAILSPSVSLWTRGVLVVVSCQVEATTGCRSNSHASLAWGGCGHGNSLTTVYRPPARDAAVPGSSSRIMEPRGGRLFPSLEIKWRD